MEKYFVIVTMQKGDYQFFIDHCHHFLNLSFFIELCYHFLKKRENKIMVEFQCYFLRLL